jgi:hypothetical protein
VFVFVLVPVAVIATVAVPASSEESLSKPLMYSFSLIVPSASLKLREGVVSAVRVDLFEAKI